MLNRRDAIMTAGALAIGSVSDVIRAEEPSIDINDTLTNIACVLSASEHVADVDMHLVDKPTVGLAQWRWLHFNEWLTAAEFAKVETVNGQLLHVMKDAFDRGDMGMERLMLEGLVEGKMRDQVQCMRDIQYDMIVKLMRAANPFLTEAIQARPAFVNRKIDDEHHLRRRTWHTLNDNRRVLISPLGRLGAGYVLATQRNVLFDAAEDPEIDRRAEAAQHGGDEKEFNEWVMRKRNRHFVKLIRENGRRVNHLLVGANHDLRNEIEASNAEHDERISHVVISVKGLLKDSLEDKPNVQSQNIGSRE